YETIHVFPINEIHSELFEKAQPKGRTETSQSEEIEQEVRFHNSEVMAIYEVCRREGFTIKLSKEIAIAAAMASIDSIAFDGYSDLAAIEHAKNRLDAKVTVEHHGHLLKYKLEQVRKEQDRIEERMMAPSVAAK